MPEFATFLQLNDGLRIGGILVDGDSTWVHRVWLGQRLAEEPLRRPSSPLPDGGFFIARALTSRVIWFGRAFLEHKNDPRPAAEAIRNFTKVYPYQAGGFGTPLPSSWQVKPP
jgi:hypothetical protein